MTSDNLSLDLDVQYACSTAGLPTEAEFTAWVTAVLQKQKDSAALTIRIVDENEGRALNYQYRHKDYATNVLSFPVELPAGVNLPVLGDLVICAPVVQREAQEQGKSPEAHWAHLVVHGCLHLLNFDHQQDSEAEEMERIELEILGKLGYSNPYLVD